MPNKWTYEQRRKALGDLHAVNPDAGMESFNSGVSYNSEMVDIACERNALRKALTKLSCLALTHIADAEDWSEYQYAVDVMAETGGPDAE